MDGDEVDDAPRWSAAAAAAPIHLADIERAAEWSPRREMDDQLRQAEADLVVRRCRVCGCTANDCRQCIEATGHPCYWVDRDLCSRCAGIGSDYATAGPDLFGGFEPIEIADDLDWATEVPSFWHNVVGHPLLWALRRWPLAAEFIHNRTDPTRPRRSGRG